MLKSRTMSPYLDKLQGGAAKKPSVKKSVRVIRSIKPEDIKNSLGYAAPSRSSGSKYPGALSRYKSSHTYNHNALRQNTRDAFFDSPIPRAIAERFSDSIVDVGLKVEFTPRWKQLGVSEDYVQAWAEDHEERFDAWMSSKDVDVSGLMTGYQMQWLYSFMQQRDNDNFVRFYYTNDRRFISPLQLGFIDPSQIKSDRFTSTLGPTRQHDGIQRDMYNRELAYKVWLYDGSGTYIEKSIPAIGTSGRVHMIHGFRQEYAGQGRGYPRFSHALTEFEKLTDFSLSKILQAISQSNINMYVKPSQDNPASDPMEGLPNAGPRQMIVDTGGSPTVAGLDNAVLYSRIPEATIDTPGSTAVFSLQQGEDLKYLEHKIQGESYDAFVNSFVSFLSASVGQPIEATLMKFNANYSASRAALVIFWRICKIWRQEMDADFMTPIIFAWLSEEIASGRSRAPGWADPRVKAAWVSHNLFGVPMPNIDPSREYNAYKAALEIQATNQDRVARETTGTSARDNIAKNAKLFKSTPIPPWAANAAKLGQTVTAQQIESMLEDLKR